MTTRLSKRSTANPGLASRAADRDVAEGGRQRVLVADGNTGRGRRLLEACCAAGFAGRLAAHGAAALEMALAEGPAVVIAQLDLPLVDAVKLAEILRANPRTRAARFVFLGPGEGLGTRGAVGDRLLSPESRPDEIVAEIELLVAKQGQIDSLEDADCAAEGELAQLPLAEVLQTFLLQGRTGRLSLDCRSGVGEREMQGEIVIEEGEVIWAEEAGAEGEKALFRLLAARQGHFRFVPGTAGKVTHSIRVPTRRLLLEGLRQCGEWDRLAPQLPPMDSPVALTVANADLPNIVHPLTQEVLLLLEIYGSVREVVDHCSFPDYQVLRTLHTLQERGIVRLGRAPLGPTPQHSETGRGLFSEIQVRRFRDWLQETSGASASALPDAKLLVIASSASALASFAHLLDSLAEVEFDAAFDPDRNAGETFEQLASLARIAVGENLGVRLVNLPWRPSLAPFWPVAGRGALGALCLLDGPLGDAVSLLRPAVEALGRLPRARTFHAVLLGKGDRLSPDEVRENLSLIDEGSLFLLPFEGSEQATGLLRSLLARVMP